MNDVDGQSNMKNPNRAKTTEQLALTFWSTFQPGLTSYKTSQ